MDKQRRAELSEWAPPVFVVCFVSCVFILAMLKYRLVYMENAYQAQMSELVAVRELVETSESETDEEPLPVIQIDDLPKEPEITDYGTLLKNHKITLEKPMMLTQMRDIHLMNADTVGWLTIKDTNVDYPVMQTMRDEEFYLDRDFQKNYSANGCLIMDTDSVVGTGTKANDYKDGTLPSTNLIIHGHNMKNGSMFGNLDLYRKQDYEKEHEIISFDSLYEHREYQIVSVFQSQVFLVTQNDVFKFYKFFNSYTEEEFHDFYDNIKEMALYDTGVTAEYGDEFITLSVCAYHVENGRLVIVAKRVL